MLKFAHVCYMQQHIGHELIMLIALMLPPAAIIYHTQSIGFTLPYITQGNKRQAINLATYTLSNYSEIQCTCNQLTAQNDKVH